MSQWQAVISFAATLALACAAPVTLPQRYTPPQPSGDVVREAHIPEEFDLVWDRTVRRLAESFFVVNNISKESRLINVSFSIDSAASHIDCGMIVFSELVPREVVKELARATPGPRRSAKRTFRETVYDVVELEPVSVSSRSTYQRDVMMRLWDGDHLMTQHILRRVKLGGRANLYIAPSEDGGTRVSANAIFTGTVMSSGYVVRADYSPERHTDEETFPINPPPPFTFHLSSAGKAFVDTDGRTCISTGELERDLLNLSR